MKDDKKFREELIGYIKANEPYYVAKNPDNYTTTTLVMIKTEIEIQLEQENKVKR